VELCAVLQIINAVYVLFSTCPYGLWPLLLCVGDCFCFGDAAAVDIHNDNEDAADEVDGVLGAMIAIFGPGQRGHNSSLHFVAN